MVIKKKAFTISEKEFIEKGSCTSPDKGDDEWKYISLRIPKKMVITIDGLVKSRVGRTRTSWILGALQTTIEDEQNGR